MPRIFIPDVLAFSADWRGSFSTTLSTSGREIPSDSGAEDTCEETALLTAEDEDVWATVFLRTFRELAVDDRVL
jgi:hypothetical protein